MFSYSDEVINAHMQERRGHLLAEAATHRLLRGQSDGAAGSSGRRARRSDRWLAAAGARLVMWGERLQASANSRQTEVQEVAGA